MAAPKGFDKEYIFNLIMPSSSEPQEEEPETPAEPEPEPVDEVQDTLAVLRARINQPMPPTVQLRPTKDLVLVNLVEQLVADRLDAVFEKFNCCRCDKCRRDVAALALNALPPQYVVAAPEEVPDLLADADAREVPGALVKAILQVKGSPKH